MELAWVARWNPAQVYCRVFFGSPANELPRFKRRTLEVSRAGGWTVRRVDGWEFSGLEIREAFV